MTARQRLALGAYGEGLAARHLVGQGMVLLDRNWRCEAGEIDLVLRDGPVLVVCEVKTRSSTAYGSPARGGDRAQGRAAAPAGRPVAGRARRAPRGGAHRPGRRAGAAPAARPRVEHVRGVG